ncbi:MAG: tetratricopeptide repeat protein [Kiritimatiellae bacterium]|nr:tetratricopeptide repeat protein [Kiritimatiellia bacterium]
MKRGFRKTWFGALAVLVAGAGTLFAGEELDLSRQALRDGLWKIALVHAEAAQQDPQDRTKARLVALEALDALGENQKALEQLALWTDENDEAFRYRKALALSRLGRRAAADDALKNPFSQPEWHLAASRLRARIAVEDGRAADAVASFKAALAAAGALTNASARTEIALEWARFACAGGAETDALGILRGEGALEAPGAAGDEARLLASELHAAAGNANEARALWRRLVASTASKDASRRAAYRLGFDELSSPATATSGVSRIRALVRENPDDPDAREAAIRLADHLLAAGDAEGAYDEYRRFLEANPASALDARVIENRGWALMALGRRAEAIGAFARAAQVATNGETRARCLYKQADALVADGRPADAAALYAQVASSAADPLAARAVFAEADALERAGQTEKAAERYRAVVAAGGERRFRAALRLAAQNVSAGRNEDAIGLYASVATNAAATLDERVDAHAGRGRANYRAYRFRDARADFGKVAELAPSRADEMRFLKALCLYGEGGDADAKAEALDLFGKTGDAALKADLSLWLAKWCYNHREWRESQSHYEAYAAHARGEKGADALTWAARCASACGDDAKAVELTTRAVKAAPDAPFLADVLLVQGEALMELARFAEAVIVFDRVKTAAPSDEAARRAAIRRADALYALGADNTARYADALKAYQDLGKTAALTPSERIATAYRVGRLLEKMNRKDEAEDQLYANVVLAWRDARAKGAVFDENACRCFAQAAFKLSENYAAAGDAFAAAAVLKLVVDSGTASAKEASRRLEQFEKKGFVR